MCRPSACAAYTINSTPGAASDPRAGNDPTGGIRPNHSRSGSPRTGGVRFLRLLRRSIQAEQRLSPATPTQILTPLQPCWRPDFFTPRTCCSFPAHRNGVCKNSLPGWIRRRWALWKLLPSLGESITRLVVVDTRQRGRISHVAQLLDRDDVTVPWNCGITTRILRTTSQARTRTWHTSALSQASLCRPFSGLPA